MNEARIIVHQGSFHVCQLRCDVCNDIVRDELEVVKDEVEQINDVVMQKFQPVAPIDPSGWVSNTSSMLLLQYKKHEGTISKHVKPRSHAREQISSFLQACRQYPNGCQRDSIQ